MLLDRLHPTDLLLSQVLRLAENVCACSRQMLDNFGNFASWTEWSLAFNLFFEWRPDPNDPSKRIQARSPPSPGMSCYEQSAMRRGGTRSAAVSHGMAAAAALTASTLC